MLNPCSPPGSPQPTIRSSTWDGSSWGTLASAAVTIWASRSSGLIEVSDPLPARPMGERAVATMTASGIPVPPGYTRVVIHVNRDLLHPGQGYREGQAGDRRR